MSGTCQCGVDLAFEVFPARVWDHLTIDLQSRGAVDTEGGTVGVGVEDGLLMDPILKTWRKRIHVEIEFFRKRDQPLFCESFSTKRRMVFHHEIVIRPETFLVERTPGRFGHPVSHIATKRKIVEFERDQTGIDILVDQQGSHLTGELGTTTSEIVPPFDDGHRRIRVAHGAPAYWRGQTHRHGRGDRGADRRRCLFCHHLQAAES